MKQLISSVMIAGLIISVDSFAEDNVTHYRLIDGSSGESIPYAVHLPNGFDPEENYPVLIGPGDGVEDVDPGFYWSSDPYSHGWIIVDAQLWEADTRRNLDGLLDAILAEYKVEGRKFHAVCWSANSAGIFRLATEHSARFHSITGMAGNPSGVSTSDIEALRDVRIQFVVGENDRGWQRSARRAHEQLQEGGIDSTFEIVPGAGHVMHELVGQGFMQRLEKLRIN